jgi:hypothetical protein
MFLDKFIWKKLMAIFLNFKFKNLILFQVTLDASFKVFKWKSDTLATNENGSREFTGLMGRRWVGAGVGVRSIVYDNTSWYCYGIVSFNYLINYNYQVPTKTVVNCESH